MRQGPGWLFLGAVAAGSAIGAAWLGASAPLRGQAAVPAIGAAVAGGFGGEDTDGVWAAPEVVHLPGPPMTAAATRVWLKMQEPVAFNFPDETPLIDLLKYVKEATRDTQSFPKGVSFYIEPQGLRNADKTPASPISIDLEDIPLATTLKLALSQLDLRYTIHPDGFLVISDTEAPDAGEADAQILQQLSEFRGEIRDLRRSLSTRAETAEGGGMRGAVCGMGGVMSVPPVR